MRLMSQHGRLAVPKKAPKFCPQKRMLTESGWLHALIFMVLA